MDFSAPLGLSYHNITRHTTIQHHGSPRTRSLWTILGLFGPAVANLCRPYSRTFRLCRADCRWFECAKMRCVLGLWCPKLVRQPCWACDTLCSASCQLVGRWLCVKVWQQVQPGGGSGLHLIKCKPTWPHATWLCTGWVIFVFILQAYSLTFPWHLKIMCLRLGFTVKIRNSYGALFFVYFYEFGRQWPVCI